MSTAARTSAESLNQQFPGQQLAIGVGPAWQNLLATVHARPALEYGMLVPAVPEPQIVWLLQGKIVLEEREIGGDWKRVEVDPGDLFLTTSPEPYEVRWSNSGPEAALVFQLYVGLPLLAEAAQDLFGHENVSLREFSGQRDETMLALLEQLRQELERSQASPLFVQSLGRALAVHLVRSYGQVDPAKGQRKIGLSAFQLSQLDYFLEAHLDQNLHLAEVAQQVGLSEFHFSRLFKKTTGLSPSRYLLRLRIDRARRLLLESQKSVLDVGLDVGYSSASHFTEVFRRETGATPSEYRSKI